MDAWLIYDEFESKRNKDYIQLYFDECNKRNIKLHLLLSEEIEFGVIDNKFAMFQKHNKLVMPQFVICRTVNPLLTKHIELMGVKIFNNYFVSSICNDKKKTYQYISNEKVRIMDTIFTSGDFCGSITFPVVLKPSNGKGGENVFLVRNNTELQNTIKIMPKSQIIIQKAASELGKDLRGYVVGKKIITSILRVSTTDFRSNYCLGGTAEIYDLSMDEKTIIYKIIDMFDFGLVGIDFIFDFGKLMFNEIEDVVGSRMVYSKTKINIASEYLDYILTQI